MTEMALLDAAPRPPGLRSRFVEGIGGLGLHVLEAGSSQTWAPGSPSPDPKWRLVTEVLGWGRGTVTNWCRSSGTAKKRPDQA